MKNSNRIFIIFLWLIPLGFASKAYHGAASGWVNNFAGGILYEIFWCVLIFFFWPRRKGLTIATVVFLGTSLLEFLQLWHPKILEIIRSTSPGKILLGTTFSWLDFPHYLAGCLIGYFIIIHLGSRKDASVPLEG